MGRCPKCKKRWNRSIQKVSFTNPLHLVSGKGDYFFYVCRNRRCRYKWVDKLTYAMGISETIVLRDKDVIIPEELKQYIEV